MGAKDTIISASEFEVLIQHIHGRKFPTTEEELGDLIADACRPPVEAQAEISFRMGKSAGIREVVDDLTITMDNARVGYTLGAVEKCLKRWQAKLKNGE